MTPCINVTADTTTNLSEDNYEDIVSIYNIETIDLTDGDGNIILDLDSDDIFKQTNRNGNDQPIESTNDDEFTNFTYFDNGGNMMAEINIRNETDNTGT